MDTNEDTRNSFLTRLGVLDSRPSVEANSEPATSAGTGIFGLAVAEEQSEVVLVPVPFEATASYGSGAADGPQAILEASQQVDLLDVQVGSPHRAGIFLQPESTFIRLANEEAKPLAQRLIHDLGEGRRASRADVDQVNRASRRVNEWLSAEVSSLLRKGKLVGIVGGDHSVPFGSLVAHASKYGDFGILHLDAHADLRSAYQGFRYSHASIMERVLAEIPEVVSLVQVAVRDLCEEEEARIQTDDRISTYYEPGLVRARLEGHLLDVFGEAVSNLPQQVYLSFDIDGLEPGLCPGTGTPVPGGLSFGEAALLMETVVSQGKRIIGFDLCEVAPRPNDQWDGNVGARLLYKMIGFALKSRS